MRQTQCHWVGRPGQTLLRLNATSLRVHMKVNLSQFILLHSGIIIRPTNSRYEYRNRLIGVKAVIAELSRTDRRFALYREPHRLPCKVCSVGEPIHGDITTNDAEEIELK
jgi:hypothetical protein